MLPPGLGQQGFGTRTEGRPGGPAQKGAREFQVKMQNALTVNNEQAQSYVWKI